MKVQERSYKERLMGFANQLEGVSSRKSKAKEKLYEVGLQIKSTINSISDIVRATK